MALDIASYFARIGYSGSRSPTLETLHGITRAHSETVPFENLDVLLGRPIHLFPEALFEKIVINRRGGYCFEQNGLLLAMLEELGFDVKPLSARVRIDRPRDFVPSRTHVFLRVELEGLTYLTDVGVGALSLTRALRFTREEPQATPHETRRIVFEDGRYFHQALLGGTWSDVCEFTLEEMPLIDREVANFWTSSHPGSHFKTRLICARAGEDGRRLVLVNDDLKERAADGSSFVTKVRSADELVTTLSARFGLHFPEGTRFGPPGSPFPV